MYRLVLSILICLFSFPGFSLNGQISESPIRVFGYFQTSFQHESNHGQTIKRSSFTLQQLNLFFQKDLAADWTAFVNFEILNSLSMSKQWGAINLEEAWIRYRSGSQFNLKLGLQIPEFNNLNQIKNRTPLLPYIIRPLVYETSFNEFLAIGEFIPEQAYVQVYGFIPTGLMKFDYAVYVGNSPNISTREDVATQSGRDTTDSFLFGGRVGFRYKEFKAGVSGTFEKSNDFDDAAELLNIDPKELKDIPRLRIGGDFSFIFNRIEFESEFINVRYDEDIGGLDVDRDFYYINLGYQVSEPLFLYFGYYKTDERIRAADLQTSLIIETPGVGVSYKFNDRMQFKAQYARVRVSDKFGDHYNQKWNFFALATSVFF